MADTKQKVLVAYATWAGSTADVAERVAAVLNRHGFAAEPVPADRVRDTAGYHAVVLGTAVRAGKLKPDALKFIERNKADMSAKPFAAFVVCLAAKGCDEKSRATAGSYLEPVRAQLKPLSEGLFAGVYDPAKVNFVMRTVMDKMVKAPPGDFRRWDEIETWATGLVPLLGARPAAGN